MTLGVFFIADLGISELLADFWWACCCCPVTDEAAAETAEAEAAVPDAPVAPLPFFSFPFLCLKVSEAWFKLVVDPNSATGAE